MRDVWIATLCIQDYFGGDEELDDMPHDVILGVYSTFDAARDAMESMLTSFKWRGDVKRSELPPEGAFLKDTGHFILGGASNIQRYAIDTNERIKCTPLQRNK